MSTKLAGLRNLLPWLSAGSMLGILPNCTQSSANHAETTESTAQSETLASDTSESGTSQSDASETTTSATDSSEDTLASTLTSDDSSDTASNTDDTLPDDVDYRSGTRIKANEYIGSDGSRQLAGWWDEMLQISCEWMVAKDDHMRCLPANPSMAYFFADKECQQPLVYDRENEGSVIRIMQFRHGSNPAYYDFILRVGAVQSESEIYTSYDGKGCTKEDLPNLQLRVTKPVEPALFAALELDRNEVQAGLTKVSGHSEDGAELSVRLEIDATKEPCTMLRLTSDEASHCVPNLRAYIEFVPYHEDNACSGTIIAEKVRAYSSVNPQIAVHRPSLEVCEDTSYDLYSTSSSYTGKIYHDYNSECSEISLDGYWIKVAEPLAGDGFPTLKPCNIGSTRLLNTFQCSEQNTPLLLWPVSEGASPRYWDSELNLRCERMRTTAGMYCLPDYSRMHDHMFPRRYLDSGCSKSAAIANLHCGIDPQYLVIKRETNQDIVEIREINGREIVTLYSDNETGPCQKESMETEVYRVGDVVPFDHFVKIDEKILQ